MDIRTQTHAFTDTQKLKQRFRQLGERSSQEQEIVDRLDIMGEGLLALDQSDQDQDKEPGSVAVSNKQGTFLAYAQANPFGGVISMDILDERQGEPKEYSKSTELFYTTYSSSEAGEVQQVRVNDGGMAALAQRMEGLT